MNQSDLRSIPLVLSFVGLLSIFGIIIAGFVVQLGMIRSEGQVLPGSTILGYTTETVYTESAQPAAPATEAPAPEVATEDSKRNKSVIVYLYRRTQKSAMMGRLLFC